MPAINPPQPTQYLFIDGGYLDRTLAWCQDSFYEGAALPIEYTTLALGFEKVFYYHCPPLGPDGQDLEETDPRLSAYLEKMQDLSNLRGWHVFHGVLKRQQKRNNQKEVDVQLAVDLLTHSFKRNMSQATLIAGDQDFRPVVEAVVREGMFLTLWSDPRHTSRPLRDAADSWRSFDIWQFNALLPSDFEGKCRLPERHFSTVPTRTEWWIPIAEATTAVGRRFLLFSQKNSTEFGVCSQHKVDGVYYEMYQLNDPAFLRHFVNVMKGPVEWNELS